MKVSVIILNYNGKDFIQDCVDSVLQSSYKKIDIIILVRNNSVIFVKIKYFKILL